MNELETRVFRTGMMLLRAMQPITMAQLQRELYSQTVGVHRDNALMWASWFAIVSQENGLTVVEDDYIDLTIEGWKLKLTDRLGWEVEVAICD